MAANKHDSWHDNQAAYQRRLAAAEAPYRRRFIPWGIFSAFRIAFRNLFRPNIVIQYPWQKYELPERARWAVRMKYDDAGNHKCQACLICEKTCPDYIIRIDVEAGEDRSKFIKSFEYQQGACMMCGLCVEACPFDALRVDNDYELAHIDEAGLTMLLLEDTPAAARPARKEGGSDA
ncbi:MAG: 4Fe-4S binding protein [Coriobacteriia bacterium]|nr:4Fe-4S binding protein [Coriobacteriia bacterium]